LFDPKTEPKEFVAASRGEAVAEACRFFGLEESELTIVEPEPESVSGLSARTLIVAAPPASQRAPRRRDDDDRGDRGRDRDRGGRGRDRDRGDRDRGGRGRGRDRGGDRDRGGRGRGRDRGDRDRGGRDRDDDRGDRDRGGRGRGRDEERAAAAPLAPDEPSEATVDGELGDLGEFVRGVVERMKVGSFTISEDGEEEGLIVVRLTGNAAMRLSTAETRVGDAIQLLANQVAIKGGKDGPRVVVDVEGDRTRRDAYLEQLARRAADRASSTSEAVALDPMNGKDRRAIHVALRDEDGIATMSIGEGQYRQVVVVPEGADEYEEALRKSDEAARNDD